MNGKGSPVMDFNFSLLPKDFCSSTLLSGSEVKQQVLVTFEGVDLYQRPIEARLRMIDLISGVEELTAVPTKERKMSSSPVEELS